MPEEPTDSQSPEAQGRDDRGWLLWVALAILLLVVAWLLWDYLSRSASTDDTVIVKTTAAQLPVVRPDVEYETADSLDDEEEPTSPGVPDVVGLMTSDAVGTLERAGYNPRVTKVYSATKPRGVVFEQVPAGGATADLGTEVSVLVSNGSQPSASVKVPKLVGLKKATALDRIEAAGLDARVMTQPRYEGAGKVLEQSPSPGTMVESGSKVFILVITSY